MLICEHLHPNQVNNVGITVLFIQYVFFPFKGTKSNCKIGCSVFPLPCVCCSLIISLTSELIKALELIPSVALLWHLESVAVSSQHEVRRTIIASEASKTTMMDDRRIICLVKKNPSQQLDRSRVPSSR